MFNNSGTIKQFVNGELTVQGVSRQLATKSVAFNVNPSLALYTLSSYVYFSATSAGSTYMGGYVVFYSNDKFISNGSELRRNASGYYSANDIWYGNAKTGTGTTLINEYTNYSGSTASGIKLTPSSLELSYRDDYGVNTGYNKTTYNVAVFG